MLNRQHILVLFYLYKLDHTVAGKNRTESQNSTTQTQT